FATDRFRLATPATTISATSTTPARAGASGVTPSVESARIALCQSRPCIGEGHHPRRLHLGELSLHSLRPVTPQEGVTTHAHLIRARRRHPRVAYVFEQRRILHLRRGAWPRQQ